ncbi:TIGR03089 family protein [Nocardioides bruguierae]|uniref:TIGR03089 family protein n=1 Tax=Nocardioides bruguierae TaxID=2945102 RepID=A0A9X2D5H9_9ACTN|nr:TIGR03089 family protein [Nocardioides bruguierae]MCM0619384.1 TIGR03089 family protein [Nocardioides bruguierae]
MTTFSALLQRELHGNPGRPLVTFYDVATGERTELSVTTYANWVAKTASLLVEEHDLERGDTLVVDLPTHWLAPVVLGAAWTVGLRVVLAGGLGAGPLGAAADEADAVVCGAPTLEEWAPRAGDVPVLASALLPLGVRFREPVPADVVDLGVAVWSQPDAFAPYDPPTGEDEAVLDPAGGPAPTQSQVLGAAAAGSLLPDGGRLLAELSPASPAGLGSFVEPLARSGSLVLVAGADAERLAALAGDERVDAWHPASGAGRG